MPIINKKEFEERLEMLSAEVMVEVIDIFRESYPERKQNIEEALAQQNAEKLEFEIHALKNDLSQFGAEKLFSNTQSILEKIRENSGADFNKEVAVILEQIDNELIPELNNWYNQQS